MKFVLRQFLVLLLAHFVFLVDLFGQGIKQFHGSPFIKNYTVEDYNGSSQVWAIAQDQRGIMYFGDGQGLLEYDGTSWRKYHVENYSVIRSIDIDSSGLIYVGATNDFGYFKPDSLGSLTYISLIEFLPDSVRAFQSVWKTIINNEGVYFVCRDYIFRWDKKNIEIINVNLQSLFAFKVNGRIYLKDNKLGLSVLEGSNVISLPNCEEINEYLAGYFHISSFEKNKITITLNYRGFYEYDLQKKKLSKYTVPELTTQYLNKNLGFYPIKSQNGEIVFATISGGIIYINKKGEITRIINKTRGLNSNCVYSIYFDKDNNLWAATQNGISRIDVSYPVLKYSYEQGIDDYILSFKVFNNTQYISTTNKVYYLPEYKPSVIDDNHNAREVDDITDCWDLFEVKNHFLAGHRTGVSEIKNNKAKRLVYSERVLRGLYNSEHHPDKIFLGLQNGILIATYEENNNELEIVETHKIRELKGQIRAMAVDSVGNLWAATYNSGILMIRFLNDSLTEYTVSRFDEKNGLPHEIHECSIEIFDNRINIFTVKGIYKPVFPDKRGADSLIRFIHDSYWGKVFTHDSTATFLAEQIDGNKFFLYGHKPGIFEKENEAVKFQNAAFVRLNDAYSVVIENDFIKLGTSKALYIFDMKAKKDYHTPFNVIIRRVLAVDDSLLFDGSYYDKSYKGVSLTQNSDYQPVLDYKDNSLKFEFSAIFYEEAEKNRYQYMIEGFDKTWSKWSTQTAATYTNIPEGAYIFKVKARNLYGTESEITTYEFVINSPWYRTWWAYVLYIILLVILIRTFVKIYTRNLKHQNIRLEKTINRRTSELQEAVGTLERQKIALRDRQSEVLAQNEELYQKREELELMLQKLNDTQEQLIQSEKMASLGILTAGLAHEINNPVNFISAGTVAIEEFLNHHYPDTRKQLNHLFLAIDTGIKRTTEIVRSLSKYSGQGDYPLIPSNINKIIDKALLIVTEQYEEQIKFEKSYSLETPIVLCNESQVHQALLNVIINSVQAIKKSGLIKINTKIEDGFVYIDIEDNGSGINQKNLRYIFDPFFTTKSPGKGTGLGLSIAKKIIQEHNGFISCKSELGKGTQFYIKLPVLKKDQDGLTYFR